MSTLDVTRGYVTRGWSVVPVPFKSKRPVLSGWQDLRLDAANLREFFNGPPSNIGVLLGAPSGDLVDVDLDPPETNALADMFLPKTDSEFGRRSKPRSHRLYVTVLDTEKFSDIE